MRPKAERRKLTFKHIRRNYRNKSTNGEITSKEEAQPHRLYKGNNLKINPRFIIRAKQLRDLKNEIKSKQMLEEEIDETDENDQ